MYQPQFCSSRSGSVPAAAVSEAIFKPKPFPKTARIGLALSGGGIRAAVFHLGVLKWMAELGLLEQLRHISTVSGASLAVALLYTKNGGRFPESGNYLTSVLPAVRETILNHDIQDRALMSLTVRPWNWRKKANLLAEAIECLWGVRGLVCDLPDEPLWSINCTTFETGKDFRITPLKMGDYKIGYAQRPAISIAEAAAASAGFPVLIGPYRLAPGAIPEKPALHLWDGGVYDNLGLEALYKIADNGHLTGDLDCLIISNASSPNGSARREFFSPVKNLKRLLEITMDQVNSLRSRDVIDYFKRMENGSYLRIGAAPGGPLDLPPAAISYVRRYPTTLASPTPEHFDLILRHGYEVARAGIALPDESQ